MAWIFGHLLHIDKASDAEPYWVLREKNGHPVRLLFSLHLITEKDGDGRLISLIIGRYNVKLSL